MNAPGHVAIAGIAQKMVNILHFNCPANYQCGGPSYGALASIDSILHLMGAGVAILQRKSAYDTTNYQRNLRSKAITGTSIIDSFIAHKSQILAGGLFTVAFDVRKKALRESQDVTEGALLTLLQWYLKKTGASVDAFVEKLKDMTHDDLVQLESTL